jgi:hypothetical protein
MILTAGAGACNRLEHYGPADVPSAVRDAPARCTEPAQEVLTSAFGATTPPPSVEVSPGEPGGSEPWTTTCTWVFPGGDPAPVELQLAYRPPGTTVDPANGNPGPIGVFRPLDPLMVDGAVGGGVPPQEWRFVWDVDDAGAVWSVQLTFRRDDFDYDYDNGYYPDAQLIAVSVGAT